MAYGILLCDDMMFTSRITGTARDLGLSLKTARSAKELMELSEQEPPTCVIVDLSHADARMTDLIESLRAVCPRLPRVVGYGSHVDTATLQAARDAGCDLVLPRSKFVQDLPHALPEWIGQTSS
jgi:DNA-binding NarL/FixJ family response regulator